MDFEQWMQNEIRKNLKGIPPKAKLCLDREAFINAEIIPDIVGVIHDEVRRKHGPHARIQVTTFNTDFNFDMLETIKIHIDVLVPKWNLDHIT